MEGDFLQTLHEVRRMEKDVASLAKAAELPKAGANPEARAAEGAGKLLGKAVRTAYAPVADRVDKLVDSTGALQQEYKAKRQVGGVTAGWVFLYGWTAQGPCSRSTRPCGKWVALQQAGFSLHGPSSWIH